jgi:four helix bundle protein
MKIDRFEDLECRQEARNIVNGVYTICRVTGLKSDFSLLDQIRKAAISLMANIAEGFSRKGKREFAQFLFTAKASAAELQSHLYVALAQKYIAKTEFKGLYEDLDKVQRKVSN